MLDTAAFAFLIMTAEDEQTNGTLHARQNVVHEAGVFQGRLGFEKAIILWEEGCEQFSNIQGLTHIPFPKGRISAAFEEIRRVLEREQASLHELEPHTEVVDIDIPPQNNGRTFPLKCYVTLRNASAKCADVRLIKYLEKTVPHKRFVPDVLQVNLANKWYPTPDGVDRVSVLPDQLFRAWVGLDHSKFGEDQVKELRGRIGTLVFSINGKPVNMQP
jgi:hypothetical protein